MNRGFYTIMCAQFLSSLADNALLIAAIALLTSINAPDWMTPLLKLFFVVSYVCLAAWVGIFADSMPKGRVMFLTNFVKAVGCLLMLTELLPPQKLVVANGWIEGLTVGSIILGVVLGGVLIKPEIAQSILDLFHLDALGLSSFAEAAIFAIAFVYLAASAVNLAIPDTGVRYPPQKFDPVDSIKGFVKSCRLLWSDRLGQISLSVTTLFWGAGAVLQFLVLKWCDHALGMDLSQGAVMQAVVSLGIAVGAFLAAAKVPLKKSLNVLPMGICMGVLVVGASYFTRDIAPAGGLSLFGFELSWAVMIAGLIMILVGICAGFFVVPMNALLQHRGHVLMSAGRSIAVQNFNENSSILVMLGVYSLLIKADLSVPATMMIFGVFVSISMLLVILKHRRNQAEYDSTHLIGEGTRHVTEEH